MKYLPLLLCCLSICACSPAEQPADTYAFHQPEHFPPPAYDLGRNPVSEAGFKLGKKLFDDPRLSSDRSVACNNCHVQATAFADPQHRLSQGVFERTGTRNAPQIANLAFYDEFFWDGGVSHLDFVPTNAIENPLEMDESLAGIVAFLRNDPEYPGLFQNVFATDTITSGLMLHAFSQYMLLLISDRAKYDDVVLGRNGASFTPAEARGERLFEDNCAGCHRPPLFTNQDFAGNGLDELSVDEGRAAISGLAADRGKFRVPSLRNVARTAPYMHDGRLPSLEAVLDHYATGIIPSANLAPELRNGIPLTPQEQQDIITFLETLTDWEFVSDERF